MHPTLMSPFRSATRPSCVPKSRGARRATTTTIICISGGEATSMQVSGASSIGMVDKLSWNTGKVPPHRLPLGLLVNSYSIVGCRLLKRLRRLKISNVADPERLLALRVGDDVYIIGVGLDISCQDHGWLWCTVNCSDEDGPAVGSFMQFVLS